VISIELDYEIVSWSIGMAGFNNMAEIIKCGCQLKFFQRRKISSILYKEGITIKTNSNHLFNVLNVAVCLRENPGNFMRESIARIPV
jgi:hypothetical protein